MSAIREYFEHSSAAIKFNENFVLVYDKEAICYAYDIGRHWFLFHCLVHQQTQSPGEDVHRSTSR